MLTPQLPLLLDECFGIPSEDKYSTLNDRLQDNLCFFLLMPQVSGLREWKSSFYVSLDGDVSRLVLVANQTANL